MQRLKILKKKFTDSTSKLIFQYNKKNCKVILNNPKVLNSIDLDMINLFKKEIKIWEKKKSYPKILMLTSKNEKAFSAGGDIKDIYTYKMEHKKKINEISSKKKIENEKNSKTEEKENLENENLSNFLNKNTQKNLENEINEKSQKNLEGFFKTEYELNYLLYKLKKKNVITISLWNGFVIGGGVGISINSSYKICNSKTVLTMPESRIGLFVDVGVMKHLSYFFNRGLGYAMVLAGHRLKGEDIVLSGLGTDFVNGDNFKELEDVIFDLDSDCDFLKRNYQVKNCVKLFEEKISVEKKKKFFDFCVNLEEEFNFDSVEEIFESSSKSKIKEIQILYKNMLMNSPLSMKVNFYYLNFAKSLDLKYVFKTDLRLIQNFLDSEEFFIGVKNLLIDRSKDRPKWTYDTLEDVPNEDIVDMFLKDKVKHNMRLNNDIFDF